MADEGRKSFSVGEESETTAPQENTKGCSSEDLTMQQESEGEPKKELPADMFYEYEELQSRPFITPGSELPEDFLRLSHSFGYDSRRRANLKLLDEQTLLFIAGNLLILLDVSTEEQRYLHSCGGAGIGAVAVHPSRKYFAVAEKGNKPNIIVYEYPSLRPYRILRGSKRDFSFVDFNRDGSLLASVAGDPDFILTLWNWTQEEVTQSCKAVSQEVYRVSFSPYNPELMTSSGAGHIKFWKMASTFTGLKLQGIMGHFGQMATSDIEGYVELPDGKVISGTEWGNLLLWEGNSIKVEICRKEDRSCHAGTVQPFALEDGQLMTAGADGFIRTWDLERIDTPDFSSDSSRFEMEPINEMLVGPNVCLSSAVRSSLPDSFIWFAQDSNGAIWKLDLSFTNTAPDPECLFSFHAGPIQGLDVSNKSHLMATTALDRSVRVFDFLSNRELITSRFNQGGTTLSWAPASVNPGGGLLVTGFEDGVVRLLELYDPERLHAVPERSPGTDAELRLRQAFKPHNAAVTAVAYERNGLLLATGSSDCTVFFFTVGEKYNPIGFIQVPGPVQALEWSPPAHGDNKLLVLCRSGHVVEVQSPNPEAEESPKTFQLSDLPSRSFRFKSIKSRIKRDEEISRRQLEEEERRKRNELLEEEEEDELPPLHIPDPPSPICCGFYSQLGQFWLSVGGFDAGFLYHCQFSEDQDQDPVQRQDEPFDFRPLVGADDDPVCSMTFSSNRQLLLCGMNSGSIRIYPLQPEDHGLASMQACWALSVHDNQYGHLRHVRCSHDDLFVLTAGDDGNIFSLCLLPPEELQRQEAKVPSPRVGVEAEALALDIEDPAAYSIETAKQKLEKDILRREAELMIAEKQRRLAELQKKFKQVLMDNQNLPEHVRLKPEELQLDPVFIELAEKLKVQKVLEVRKQLAWEQERSNIALRKLQDRLKKSLGAETITVVAIRSGRQVSTYSLPPLPETLTLIRTQSEPDPLDGDAAQDRRRSRTEPAKDGDQTAASEEVVPRPPVTRKTRIKLGDRQEEKLRKEAERAEQARAKIQRRRQEWTQIYAEKPPDDFVDPQLVRAIREAKEKLRDVTRRKEPRVNAEKKKEELICLQLKIREQQTEMNSRIVALRDFKVQLMSRLAAQLRRLQEVQRRLAVRHRLPLPALPAILPEETPDRKLQCSRATLERYWTLREQRLKNMEEEGAVSLLEQLEKEMKAEEQKEEETLILSGSSDEEEEVELSELEKELQKEEEIRLLHEQNCLLQEMESSVHHFDSELLQLCRQKLHLDHQLKLLDLRLLTIFREMLLLRQFQPREEVLQEKLKGFIQEEKNITSKLEECQELLELKTQDITKLQEKAKALTAAFQASLGEENPFKEFLTKVFEKKIKRVKRKEQPGSEEEEMDSREESDSDDDDDGDSEDEGSAVDETVCPKDCEPELLTNTLQLRERRLDLEELLAEEKMVAEPLNKDAETLMKKEKVVKKNRQEVEKDLELIDQEKQQKMNQLDVVVSLQLHQIIFVTNGLVPSDLSEALVLDRKELHRLQECIQSLKDEKAQQKHLLDQDQQQQTRLLHEEKDMSATVQTLELQSNELMVQKFGRLVDLEALQMLPGNRRLEELKQEKLLLEKAQVKELRLWEARIEEELQVKMEVMETNTEHLCSVVHLYKQKTQLEAELHSRQKKTGGRQFQDYRRRSDQETIQSLQELVKTQSEQAEALISEIHFLSSKGGQVLPPHPPSDE